MYLDHFGLREAPFRITPHTEFFFAGGNRGATLEALLYAITQEEGIVKVSGEVGSGKTMLCRMLLEKLPANVETVYLANPSLSRHEILHAIAAELKSPFPDEQTQLLQKALQDRLLAIHASGRQVVVLIDEAHAMPSETLEEVRLLSNLETSRHKLLHIVLFGQPELDARLGETGMRQLKERITHNFGLEPLRRDDIGSYVMFRMRAAGYHGPDLFTAAAVQMISQASEGLTRRINIIADKALLAAYSAGTHQIDRRQITAAVRDAQFKPMHDGSAKIRAWVIGAAVVLLASAVAYLAGKQPAPDAPPAGAIALPAVPRQPVLPAVPVVAAAQATPARPAVPAPPAVPPAPTMPAPEAAPMKEVAVVGEPAGATPAPPTALLAPVAPPEAVQAAAVAVVLPTAALTPPDHAQAASSRLPSFAERLAASEEWIAKTPDTHYFIQLLSTAASSQSDVERFLLNNTDGLDPGQLRVYRSSLSGRDRLGVIYGDFPSPAAANVELARISQMNRLGKAAGKSLGKPYIRAVSKLR